MGKEQEKENKETNTKEEENKEENGTGEDTGTTEEASEETVYDKAYIENLKATMEAEKAAAVEAAKKELEDKAAEEAKISGMTPEEKAEYEAGKKEQNLADREAALSLRELKADTKALLAEQGLPVDVLESVMGKDLETTKQNIANFKKHVDAEVNDIANSERFNSMVNGVIAGFSMIAGVAVEVFDLLTTGAAFVYDNWDVIGAVFYFVAGALGFLTIATGINAIAMKTHAVQTGIATFASNVHSAALARQKGATFGATVQQYGFNAALLACPIAWVVIGILAIVAAIGVVTVVINKACGTSISAGDMIVGTIYYIMGALTNCGLLLGNILFGAIEAAKATGNNIMEVFKVSIYRVESIFYNRCID